MNAKITHEISVNTLPNVSMNLEDIVVIVPTAIRKILPMNLVKNSLVKGISSQKESSSQETLKTPYSPAWSF